jgi:hypothetical protein
MLEWIRFACERDFRGGSAKGVVRICASTRVFLALLPTLHATPLARTHRSVNVVDASSVCGLMLMRGTFSDVDGQVAPRLPS